MPALRLLLRGLSGLALRVRAQRLRRMQHGLVLQRLRLRLLRQILRRQRLHRRIRRVRLHRTVRRAVLLRVHQLMRAVRLRLRYGHRQRLRRVVLRTGRPVRVRLHVCVVVLRAVLLLSAGHIRLLCAVRLRHVLRVSMGLRLRLCMGLSVVLVLGLLLLVLLVLHQHGMTVATGSTGVRAFATARLALQRRTVRVTARPTGAVAAAAGHSAISVAVARVQ